MSPEELSNVRAVIPSQAWGIPVVKNTPQTPAPSVKVSKMFADIPRVKESGSNFSGRPGYLRTVFGEDATVEDETIFGIDKHFVCEDWSSVSTTSLDEWQEDRFLDNDCWEVDLVPK